MVIKLIKVRTTEDKRAGFLERQALWNEAMARSPGFIDVTVCTNANDGNKLAIIISWQNAESLKLFMDEIHDDVEAATGIVAFYDEIEVSIFDELDLAPETN